ncbi:type IV secretion system DNA-binding domain-containing protein [Tautonia sociabilis]|nr:type IV secretion system DNA-binding domain-containing protein [Tautonia sociabilis]
MFSNEDLESPTFFRLDRLPARTRPHGSRIHGDARFATEADLRAFLDPPDEEHPAYLDDVSLLTDAPEGGGYAPIWKTRLYLPAEIRRRNMLAVGRIGSGKTSEMFLPLINSDIKDTEASVVTIDVKGDQHQKLTPFVEKHRPGTSIVVINLTEPDRTTHAWNPFAHQDDEGTVLDDAESFCQATQTLRGSRDSPFWDSNAARWITAVILCLKKTRGAVCPADVHRALELPRDQLLALLMAHPDVAFASGVHSFLASGSHNAETVQAQAQMHLRALRDPGLASVTSINEFRSTCLFERPTILIFELHQGSVEKLRAFVNLFFAQLFREAARCAMAQPGCRLPRPLNLYLDDFTAAVGRIPDLGQHLNLARSRDVRVIAAVQSLSQIEHTYGTEARDILAAFGTKLFKSVEQHDAEWASLQSGTCTVEAVDEVQEVGEFGDGPRTVTRTVRPVARPLLLREEIQSSPEHFLYGRAWTAFFPDIPPVQLWLRAAHNLPEMAGPMAEAARRPRPARLRETPLRYTPVVITTGLPATRMTDTTSMTTEQGSARLRDVKETIGWANTSGNARKWWEALESQNRHRPGLVLRLAEELAGRKSTITEFFLAYVDSRTNNLQANLHYLDFMRLKREEEEQKRKAREQSSPKPREVQEPRGGANVTGSGNNDLETPPISTKRAPPGVGAAPRSGLQTSHVESAEAVITDRGTGPSSASGRPDPGPEENAWRSPSGPCRGKFPRGPLFGLAAAMLLIAPAFTLEIPWGRQREGGEETSATDVRPKRQVPVASRGVARHPSPGSGSDPTRWAAPAAWRDLGRLARSGSGRANPATPAPPASAGDRPQRAAPAAWRTLDTQGTSSAASAGPRAGTAPADGGRGFRYHQHQALEQAAREVRGWLGSWSD